ncbi:Hsp20/alpha crystallin family protein [Oceanidesulfovibrio indonesiensis]|uniref:Hsp20/alpha crystallin family protein n=1 Tax=Oceanidesulfovibrio indonesiensis TaxID=54767 RepID=A0A7M3MI17_9BACT|nr:Hsp20/alpha crystallin family protein [Oceanidesulfovibrio indonesiensis]TVM19334.1 Hsp20/alpha crystallin family protein [Oceanidesulfovibrio indonesiensis]
MFTRYLPELRRRSREEGAPMSIADLMEDFWRGSFTPESTARTMAYPALDIAENEDTVTVTAEVPGMKPEDIDVTLERGVLTVKGEKKFEEERKGENFHRIERSYGSFQRVVQLPTEVDEEKVAANYKDGVLTLTMPKSPAAKKRKIEISG